MKPVLAFETSSPELSIALLSSRGTVRQKQIKGYMKHAENILPAADALLKKEKLSLDKIGTFLIGRGPGSFTGLRVGFATLKGFLSVSKKEAYGALSLDLMAENTAAADKSFLCAALDARRGKVFSRLYKRVKGSWKALHPPQTLGAADWAASLPAGTLLCGEAVEHYRNFLDTQKNKKFVFLPEKSGLPRAGKLIELFLKEPKKLLKLENPKDFVPQYIRRPEAEEKMKAGELKKHRRPRVPANPC